MTLDLQRLREFAERCTAWCSHDTASVASFYSAGGSLTIIDGPPAVGRAAIAAAAQDSIATFPGVTVLKGWPGDKRRPRNLSLVTRRHQPRPRRYQQKSP